MRAVLSHGRRSAPFGSEVSRPLLLPHLLLLLLVDELPQVRGLVFVQVLVACHVTNLADVSLRHQVASLILAIINDMSDIADLALDLWIHGIVPLRQHLIVMSFELLALSIL